MNSPIHNVCENLKVFGLSGFAERTEAFRFRLDKTLNHKDRDRVYWQETGRHLPRPDRAKHGSAASRSQQQPKKARNKLVITKSTWAELMAL